jgi:outer membrane protein assembly factor BamB
MSPLVARHIASCLAVCAALYLLLAAPAPGRSRAQPPCSSTEPAPGGDWPMYGHDLANTRSQPAESTLPSRRALTLVPAWRYDTANASRVLTFVDLDTTPVIARGCVFVADGGSDVAALDMSTGRRIWRRHVDMPKTGFDAGGFVGTPVVDGHRLILIANEDSRPHAIALDTSTGNVLWTSPPVDTYPGSFSHASPIVHGGVVFVGFSVPEGDPQAHGGFALVDAANGSILAKTYTIPESDWGSGGAGGGIWSTPAVDPGTGYAFVGTGNPFSKQREHDRTNAILKVDLDRRRPAFGQVVASYKGEIDQAVPLLRDLTRPTTCKLLPENPPLPKLPEFLPSVNQARDSFACLQFDLGFGGAANLFHAADGRLLVGELQKSGVYHVVRTDDMRRERRVGLGLPCLLCNGASTAYDAKSRTVFAAVSPGSIMVAFRPGDSALRWASPIGDVVHYQPPAIADGVAYSLDSGGFLGAWDAATGVPLMHRPLAADGAADAVGTFASSGVAVANHTVYVAAGSHVIAYRPVCPPGASRANLLAPLTLPQLRPGLLPSRGDVCRAATPSSGARRSRRRSAPPGAA